MPARKRPKVLPAPPPPTLSAAERFAQAVKETEQAKRAAQQAATDRKNEAARQAAAAAEYAINLQQAKAAHARAVERLKNAKLNHKGIVEAELEWRKAKADLLELETGERPEWAPVAPPEPEPELDAGPDLESVTEVDEPTLDPAEATE
jgi:hypothetical protein